MEHLFDTATRAVARRAPDDRASRSSGPQSDGRRPIATWPTSRLVAVRIAGRRWSPRTRLRRAARRAGVAPDLVSLLLLFTESNRCFRIVDIAECLGVGKSTAVASSPRPMPPALIDKLTQAIDYREVSCRLSAAGRIAATNCLESLRPAAIEVLASSRRRVGGGRSRASRAVDALQPAQAEQRMAGRRPGRPCPPDE